MNALPARTIVTDPAIMADPGIPRVAVLMPAYNPGKAINRAVGSLVGGTYPCDIYICLLYTSPSPRDRS